MSLLKIININSLSSSVQILQFFKQFFWSWGATKVQALELDGIDILKLEALSFLFSFPFWIVICRKKQVV